MINKFLKIAGVKNEKEFYKKYPTESAFFKAHPEAKGLRKMQEGGEQKKLKQLKDFSNDPDNIGSYTQQEQTPVENISFSDAYYAATGQEYTPMEQESAGQKLKNAQGIITGIGSIIDSFVPKGEGDSDKGKKGKKIPKAQNAVLIPQMTGMNTATDPNLWASWGNTTGMPTNPNAVQPIAMDPNQTGTFEQQVAGSKDAVKNLTPRGNNDILGKLGGPMGIAQAAGDIIGGIGMIKDEKQKMKNAEKWAKVSGLVNKAASMRPELPRRRYVRPEDVPTNPNELFPTYGVGTNYLSRNGSIVRAQDGTMIGGNPTEIQNTYAPNTIYTDLAYEPLGESTRMKQFQFGGMAGNIGSSLVGGGGTGAGQIGTTLGSTAGMLIGGPVGSAIGGFLGGAVGGLFGGKTARKTKQYQKEMQENMEGAAWQSGVQGLQGMYASNMEDGGYISHNWQPQLITRFGGLSAQQVEDYALEGMDNLRTGGNITRNYMYPQDEYALGGSVKSHWGGGAETDSYNPYLPFSGETIMFRGQSHDESDGKGRTGIGISYGDKGDGHDSYTDYAEYGTDAATDMANVEVERNEPAAEIPDGETGEPSLVVYGNLVINEDAAKAIGDPKAKGKKYKHFVRDLNKKENKLSKLKDKTLDRVNNTDDNTVFGKLAMSSDRATLLGTNMQMKKIANEKTNAAFYQNAINDTADYLGIDADALAKGKIKVDKEKEKEDRMLKKQIDQDLESLIPIARNGSAIPKAQGGKKQNIDIADVARRPNTNVIATPSNNAFDANGNLKPGWFYDSNGKLSYSLMKAAGVGNPPASSSSSKQTGAKTPATSAKPIETDTQTEAASSTTKKKKSSGSRASGASVKEPVPSDYKSDYDYMNALYEAAQKQRKGDIVRKFQQEFHKRYPDFAKDIISKQGPTTYAKEKGYGNDDLRGNEDSLFGKRTIQYKQFLDKNKPVEKIDDVKPKDVPVEAKTTTKKTYTTPTGEGEKSKKFSWMDALSAVAPMFLPSDAEELDPRQLSGEMFALATNQLEPVQAQGYQPLLEQPYDISYQDQLNEITAQTRAAEKMVRNNPSALASLYGEANQAKSKVLAEQFRANQAMKANVYNKNREILNQAALKNLEIFDRQYVRQAEAKSRTKEVAQAALNSISSKYLQNQRDNRELQVYENMYNFRYDPKFRARNFNVFNPSIPNVGNALTPIYDANNNIIGYKAAEGAKNSGTVTTIEETVTEQPKASTVPSLLDPNAPAYTAPSIASSWKANQKKGGKTFKNSMVVKSFKNI